MPIYKIPGQKKDGLQKYRVVYNYTEHGKKRTKERLVYGKAQAELMEAELRREQTRSGTRKEAEMKSLTVEGLFAIYEAERGTEIRGSTMAKKRSILQTHVFSRQSVRSFCQS